MAMSSLIPSSLTSSTDVCPLQQNVGAQERVACAMGGAGLILGGLFRSGFKQAFMLVAGGALLYRGVSGRCHLYDRMGIDTRDFGREIMGPSESEHLGES